MILPILFILSIVSANLIIAHYGVAAVLYVAFFAIGFDLSIRDAMHEHWHGNYLWAKTLGLVIVSALVTVLLNWGAGKIAVASVCAFVGALIVDFLIYEWQFDRKLLFKMNLSNVCSAIVDSFLFITIAFGVNLKIASMQSITKILGGFMWSIVIYYAYKKLIGVKR